MKQQYQFILIIFILLAFVQSDAARKRGPRSGKVDNNVFKDNSYELQINVPDNWNAKLYKKDESRRVDLVCKDYKGERLRTDPTHTTTYSLLMPMVSMWVIETDKSAKEFVDDFMKNPESNDQYSEILDAMKNNWTLMRFNSFRTVSYTKLEAENLSGVNWLAGLHCMYRDSGVEGPYFTTAIVDCYDFDENRILFILGRAEDDHFNDIASQIKEIMRSVAWKMK